MLGREQTENYGWACL